MLLCSIKLFFLLTNPPKGVEVIAFALLARSIERIGPLIGGRRPPPFFVPRQFHTGPKVAYQSEAVTSRCLRWSGPDHVLPNATNCRPPTPDTARPHAVKTLISFCSEAPLPDAPVADSARPQPVFLPLLPDLPVQQKRLIRALELTISSLPSEPTANVISCSCRSC